MNSDEANNQYFNSRSGGRKRHTRKSNKSKKSKKSRRVRR